MPARNPPKTKKSKSFSPLFFLFLSLLAFLSALGLDYASWKKGEASYFFSLFSRPKAVEEENDRLYKLIHSTLSRYVPSEALNRYTDSEGFHHFMVELPFESYLELESRFASELQERNASVKKQEEEQGDHESDPDLSNG